MKTMTYGLHNDLDHHKSWENMTEEEAQKLTQADLYLLVCVPKSR